MNSDADRIKLRVIRAGIDTYQQPVVYMHRDCEVCRSEGFAALTRVSMRIDHRELIATLNVVVSDILPHDSVALSEAAWNAIQPEPDAMATFHHPEPPRSAGALRAKVFGQRLQESDYLALMQDTVQNRLSDIELAAFVTACAGERLDHGETTAFTRAMIAVGDTLDWGEGPVMDKHCVGGLPGNRTTPIVVAIIASLGYRIPKTSSRAITSPAGTADTMEVMAPVDLDLPAMRRVVEREGGCVVWGGNVRLSPADDVLIRVERPLDFDSDGQLVASILSKKVAAGSNHVLIIGPALEAMDVLRVLRGDADAPADLRERAIALAGDLLDLVPGNVIGGGRALAEQAVASGQALAKFMAICEAQGGFTEPRPARFQADVLALRGGVVAGIDNRRLSKVAKLAGAPVSPAAGLVSRLRIGDRVRPGEPLFSVHAQSRGELEYALDYARDCTTIFDLQDIEP